MNGGRIEEYDSTHWVTNSRLFREWEETKRKILEHKWIESEKAGYDIGWERACMDWMIRHGCDSTKGPDSD